MSDDQQPMADHKIDGDQFIIPLSPMIIGNQTPNNNMTFHSPDNTLLGTLDFNGSSLKFEGSAEDSAKVFIDWIAEVFSGRLAEERERCAKLCDDANKNTHHIYHLFISELAETMRRLK